jgi:glycosyltransferase involved in cell wall biosynthesis
MRVAFVIPGDPLTISGGYGYDRAIIDELRAAGHEVAVFAPETIDDMPTESRIVVDGLGLPALADRQDWFVERGAIGLIHHPTALETGHDDATREHLIALEKSLFARLKKLIVTSQATADRLAAEFGVAPEHIEIVVPGTPDAPRAAGSGGPGCEILSVGALVPRKGHDLLLRALARLFDLDWHLTIVGDATRNPLHARALVALAEELKITARVRFAGEVTPEALEALWRGADVFALATHFEGYGMAIAEALKRGLPVAVTSGGAAGALVSPEAGAVVTPGDHNTLSKSLRRMIFDTRLRRAMADAAWHIGQTLPDWQAQAVKFAAAIGN